MQTFERHQVPDESYTVYDQFREQDGKALYPQLPFCWLPGSPMSAGGSVPCGKISTRSSPSAASLMKVPAWHGTGTGGVRRKGTAGRIPVSVSITKRQLYP